MGSNFTVFQSAISALSANSQSLSVAANNISNVNTKGYARQDVVLSARSPQVIGGLELGLGVSVTAIRRIVNSFAETRLADSAGSNSQTQTYFQQLQQVESVFNEIGKDGLSKFLGDYFNAAQGVSTDPSSLTARSVLLRTAETAIDRFHTLGQTLRLNQDLMDDDIATQVQQINVLSADIVDLNERIRNAGGEALSLVDQRSLKVQELSKLADTRAVETSQGLFQVYVSGLQLISGATRSTLSTLPDQSNDNHLKILFSVGEGSTPSDITDRIGGGSLQGLLKMRDQNIPLYRDTLNELAYEFSRQVNTLHSAGFDLNGETGNNFFTDLGVSAIGSDHAATLRSGTGDHLGVESGDVIQFSGTLGTAFTASLTVDADTTLDDIASGLQAALRAATGASGTETVTVDTDGSLLVTSGLNAITGLSVSITGNTAFNNEFALPASIAGGGATGSSSELTVVSISAAESIDLDPAVKNRPQGIAAAGSLNEIPGGNSAMLAIAELANANLSFVGSNGTFTSFYGNLLSRIGGDTQSAKNQAQFASDLFEQAQVQRESISGVSLEEEQLNLIKYQAAFQAAARLVGVGDEVLKLLVNLG